MLEFGKDGRLEIGRIQRWWWGDETACDFRIAFSMAFSKPAVDHIGNMHSWDHGEFIRHKKPEQVKDAVERGGQRK